MPKGSKACLKRDLKCLWSQLSRKRKPQAIAVLALTMASSLAEMLSLGAVVPFLAVLAEPGRIWGTNKAQWVVGILGWQQPADLVLPLCLAFAGAAGIAGAVRIQTLRSTIALANGVGSDLSIALYGRTLHQPYAMHLQRNSSETISSISNQVDQVVGMINGLLQLTSAGLVSLGLVGVLLGLNSAITLTVAAIVGGGYGILLNMSQRKLKTLGPGIVRDQTKLIRSLQEGLGAIRDIILDGTQPIFEEIYGEADCRLRRNRGIGQFISLAPRYGMEAVGVMTIALAATGLVGSRPGFLGALPILGALALGAQRLLPSLQLIYSNWSGFRLNMPALSSILDDLEQPVPDAGLATAKTPLPLNSEICVKGLSFRYGPKFSWILRDADLTIRRGERIGIVGETGSGKSTLVDLLMGLLEPTMGELLVDGKAVREEQLFRWRGAIAHVPQSIFLTDSSIAENIAFGVPKASINQTRLEQASQQAQIASFIQTLPEGYNTRVGERGMRLSGGQRQRIGIARALYKQTPILVFDEATSALDQATEREVMAAVNNLSKDLTVIMIAHRLSTLERCDRLARVQQAKLVPEEIIQP